MYKSTLNYKKWNYYNDYRRIKRIKIMIFIFFLIVLLSFIKNPNFYIAHIKVFTITLFEYLVSLFSPYYLNGERNESFSTFNASVNLILLVSFFLIIYFAFRGRIARTKLFLHTFTKNTFSKGKAMWMNNKEEKNAFLHVEEGNELFYGTLISQYKSLRIFGIEMKKLSHFDSGDKYFEESIEQYIHANNLSFTINKTEEQISIVLKLKESWDKLKNSIYKLPIFTITNMYQIIPDPHHYLVLGTTRSGKSQTFILPQLQYVCDIKKEEEKPHLIITDPKGELYRESSENLSLAGYEVIKIDLVNTNESMSYNPLDLIYQIYIQELEFIKEEVDYEDIQKFRESVTRLNTSRVEDEILKIANTLYPLDTEGQNAIFTKLANSMFRTVTFLFLEECVFKQQTSEFNLYNLILYSKHVLKQEMTLGKSAPRIEKVLSELKPSHAAKRFYSSSLTDKTYSSVVTSFEAELQIYSTNSLKLIISKSTVKMKDFTEGEKPIAFFIITPDYDTKYNALVANFINQSYTEAVKYADSIGGRLNRRIIYLLEEFSNVAKISDFDKKTTVSLGRGIQFYMILQNIAQLNTVYGDEVAKTILDNTQAKLYLLAGDVDTREWFSKIIGSTTQLSTTYSGKEYKELSKTVSEEEIALVSPEMLAKTPFGLGYLSLLRHNAKQVQLRPAFTYIKKNNR